MTNKLITTDHETPRGSRLAKSEHELMESYEAMGEAYFRQGMILDRIRAEGEYKDAGFTSFDEYCNVRQPLGYKKSRCGQLIAAKNHRLLLPNIVPTNVGTEVWSEATIRPLTNKKFGNSDVRRLGKKIAALVKKGATLTASLVKKVCDDDLGVERKKTLKHREILSQTQTPANVICDMKYEVDQWTKALSSVDGAFWTDLEVEDRDALKNFIEALSSLVSLLEG